MLNQIEIQGNKAVVSFDPDIGLFRGEFIGLNGGADFYADSVDNLVKEAIISLETFLTVCQEKGIEPYQAYDLFSHNYNKELVKMYTITLSISDEAKDKFMWLLSHFSPTEGQPNVPASLSKQSLPSVSRPVEWLKQQLRLSWSNIVDPVTWQKAQRDEPYPWERA